MKPKIVRYKNKQGVIKEYVYYKDYSKPSRRGNILVSSKGVIYKDAVNKLIEKIKNSDMSLSDREEFLNNLDYQLKKRSGDIKHGISNKRLTVNGFYGLMENNALDRFFANFGSSVEQFAEDYGFDVEEVRKNQHNFHGNELTINGRTFKFKYNYEGDFYTEVL